MDYNILINEYLEGTLDADGESQLFIELSSNDELRKELRQSIELDKGLSRRVSAFVPSASSTMNIFTQLGIGTAVGAASTATALGLKQSLITFLSTYSQAIISGVIAVAVTAGSFLTFYNPSNEQIISNDGSKGYSNGITSNQPNDNNEIPIVSSISNDSSSQRVRIDTVIRYVRQYNVEQTASEFKESAIQLTQETNSKTKDDTLESKDNIFYAQESSSYVNHQIQNINFENTMYSDLPKSTYSPFEVRTNENRNLNISIEVKGNGYWSIPEPDVPQYNTPTFANIQLTGLYKIGDDFKAGIDFRQESYYQNFTGTNEIGEDFVYKQYPAYYTISLMGRYSFWQDQMYSTFGQASIGGTATGLVSRLMLGFEISPLSNLSFIFGIEGSMLTYKHQSNIFNSPKIGLNYGISFNF